MIRNSAKSNWTLEELGWKLSKQGITEDWDGLLSYFLKLTEVNSIYLENKYISEWKTAILKVIKNKL